MAYRIREGSPDDLDVVLHHRRQMFVDMGMDGESLELSLAMAAPLFAEGLRNGDYRAWFAVDPEGAVVAGAGVLQVRFQPTPRDPFDKRGWVVNVYTEPEHRRRGLAKMLMETVVAWCRAQDWNHVYLHASADGRPLYERMGFQPTNEMRLRL